MSVKTIRPLLPSAPNEYDPVYLHQLARSLENLINEVRNPLTAINNLPTAEAINSLEIGDLYQDNGFVKVVRAEDKP
jgi:HD superfamily phosphohydrolase